MLFKFTLQYNVDHLKTHLSCGVIVSVILKDLSKYNNKIFQMKIYKQRVVITSQKGAFKVFTS